MAEVTPTPLPASEPVDQAQKGNEVVPGDRPEDTLSTHDDAQQYLGIPGAYERPRTPPPDLSFEDSRTLLTRLTGLQPWQLEAFPDELPPLPLSRPSSPLRSPEVTRQTAHFAQRRLSSTAVPIRFRKPPGSSSATQRDELDSSPNARTATSPVRSRHGRAHSVEFKASREFRPLYLVERNRKSDEIDEVLPALPASSTPSRTSSVATETEFESALESPQPSSSLVSEDSFFDPLSTISDLILPPSGPELQHPELADREIEEIDGSGQVTPKASDFVPGTPDTILDTRGPDQDVLSAAIEAARTHETETSEDDVFVSTETSPQAATPLEPSAPLDDSKMRGFTPQISRDASPAKTTSSRLQDAAFGAAVGGIAAAALVHRSSSPEPDALVEEPKTVVEQKQGEPRTDQAPTESEAETPARDVKGKGKGKAKKAKKNKKALTVEAPLSAPIEQQLTPEPYSPTFVNEELDWAKYRSESVITDDATLVGESVAGPSMSKDYKRDKILEHTVPPEEQVTQIQRAVFGPEIKPENFDEKRVDVESKEILPEPAQAQSPTTPKSGEHAPVTTTEDVTPDTTQKATLADDSVETEVIVTPKGKKAKKNKKAKRASAQAEPAPEPTPVPEHIHEDNILPQPDDARDDYILPQPQQEEQRDAIERDILQPAFEGTLELDSGKPHVSDDAIVQLPQTAPKEQATTEVKVEHEISEPVLKQEEPKQEPNAMDFLVEDEASDDKAPETVSEPSAPITDGKSATKEIPAVAKPEPEPERPTSSSSRWGSSLLGAFGWGKKKPATPSTSPEPRKAVPATVPATEEKTVEVVPKPAVSTKDKILELQTAFGGAKSKTPKAKVSKDSKPVAQEAKPALNVTPQTAIFTDDGKPAFSYSVVAETQKKIAADTAEEISIREPVVEFVPPPTSFFTDDGKPAFTYPQPTATKDETPVESSGDVPLTPIKASPREITVPGDRAVISEPKSPMTVVPPNTAVFTDNGMPSFSFPQSTEATRTEPAMPAKEVSANEPAVINTPRTSFFTDNGKPAFSFPEASSAIEEKPAEVSREMSSSTPTGSVAPETATFGDGGKPAFSFPETALLPEADNDTESPEPTSPTKKKKNKKAKKGSISTTEPVQREIEPESAVETPMNDAVDASGERFLPEIIETPAAKEYSALAKERQGTAESQVEVLPLPESAISAGEPAGKTAAAEQLSPTPAVTLEPAAPVEGAVVPISSKKKGKKGKKAKRESGQLEGLIVAEPSMPTVDSESALAVPDSSVRTAEGVDADEQTKQPMAEPAPEVIGSTPIPTNSPRDIDAPANPELPTSADVDAADIPLPAGTFEDNDLMEHDGPKPAADLRQPPLSSQVDPANVALPQDELDDELSMPLEPVTSLRDDETNSRKVEPGSQLSVIEAADVPLPLEKPEDDAAEVPLPREDDFESELLDASPTFPDPAVNDEPEAATPTKEKKKKGKKSRGAEMPVENTLQDEKRIRTPDASLVDSIAQSERSAVDAVARDVNEVEDVDTINADERRKSLVGSQAQPVLKTTPDGILVMPITSTEPQRSIEPAADNESMVPASSEKDKKKKKKKDKNLVGEPSTPVGEVRIELENPVGLVERERVVAPVETGEENQQQDVKPIVDSTLPEPVTDVVAPIQQQETPKSALPEPAVESILPVQDALPSEKTQPSTPITEEPSTPTKKSKKKKGKKGKTVDTESSTADQPHENVESQPVLEDVKAKPGVAIEKEEATEKIAEPAPPGADVKGDRAIETPAEPTLEVTQPDTGLDAELERPNEAVLERPLESTGSKIEEAVGAAPTVAEEVKREVPQPPVSNTEATSAPVERTGDVDTTREPEQDTSSHEVPAAVVESQPEVVGKKGRKKKSKKGTTETSAPDMAEVAPETEGTPAPEVAIAPVQEAEVMTEPSTTEPSSANSAPIIHDKPKQDAVPVTVELPDKDLNAKDGALLPQQQDLDQDIARTTEPRDAIAEDVEAEPTSKKAKKKKAKKGQSVDITPAELIGEEPASSQNAKEAGEIIQPVEAESTTAPETQPPVVPVPQEEESRQEFVAAPETITQPVEQPVEVAPTDIIYTQPTSAQDGTSRDTAVLPEPPSQAQPDEQTESVSKKGKKGKSSQENEAGDAVSVVVQDEPVAQGDSAEKAFEHVAPPAEIPLPETRLGDAEMDVDPLEENVDASAEKEVAKEEEVRSAEPVGPEVTMEETSSGSVKAEEPVTVAEPAAVEEPIIVEEAANSKKGKKKKGKKNKSISEPQTPATETAPVVPETTTQDDVLPAADAKEESVREIVPDRALEPVVEPVVEPAKQPVVPIIDTGASTTDPLPEGTEATPESLTSPQPKEDALSAPLSKKEKKKAKKSAKQSLVESEASNIPSAPVEEIAEQVSEPVVEEQIASESRDSEVPTVVEASPEEPSVVAVEETVSELPIAPAETKTPVSSSVDTATIFEPITQETPLDSPDVPVQPEIEEQSTPSKKAKKKAKKDKRISADASEASVPLETPAVDLPEASIENAPSMVSDVREEVKEHSPLVPTDVSTPDEAIGTKEPATNSEILPANEPAPTDASVKDSTSATETPAVETAPAGDAPTMSKKEKKKSKKSKHASMVEEASSVPIPDTPVEEREPVLEVSTPTTTATEKSSENLASSKETPAIPIATKPIVEERVSSAEPVTVAEQLPITSIEEIRAPATEPVTVELEDIQDASAIPIPTTPAEEREQLSLPVSTISETTRSEDPLSETTATEAGTLSSAPNPETSTQPDVLEDTAKLSKKDRKKAKKNKRLSIAEDTTSVPPTPTEEKSEPVLDEQTVPVPIEEGARELPVVEDAPIVAPGTAEEPTSENVPAKERAPVIVPAIEESVHVGGPIVEEVAQDTVIPEEAAPLFKKEKKKEKKAKRTSIAESGTATPLETPTEERLENPLERTESTKVPPVDEQQPALATIEEQQSKDAVVLEQPPTVEATDEPPPVPVAQHEQQPPTSEVTVDQPAKAIPNEPTTLTSVPEESQSQQDTQEEPSTAKSKKDKKKAKKSKHGSGAEVVLSVPLTPVDEADRQLVDDVKEVENVAQSAPESGVVAGPSTADLVTEESRVEEAPYTVDEGAKVDEARETVSQKLKVDEPTAAVVETSTVEHAPTVIPEDPTSSVSTPIEATIPSGDQQSSAPLSKKDKKKAKKASKLDSSTEAGLLAPSTPVDEPMTAPDTDVKTDVTLEKKTEFPASIEVPGKTALEAPTEPTVPVIEQLIKTPISPKTVSEQTPTVGDAERLPAPVSAAPQSVQDAEEQDSSEPKSKKSKKKAKKASKRKSLAEAELAEPTSPAEPFIKEAREMPIDDARLATPLDRDEQVVVAPSGKQPTFDVPAITDRVKDPATVKDGQVATPATAVEDVPSSSIDETLQPVVDERRSSQAVNDFTDENTRNEEHTVTRAENAKTTSTSDDQALSSPVAPDLSQPRDTVASTTDDSVSAPAPKTENKEEPEAEPAEWASMSKSQRKKAKKAKRASVVEDTPSAPATPIVEDPKEPVFEDQPTIPREDVSPVPDKPTEDLSSIIRTEEDIGNVKPTENVDESTPTTSTGKDKKKTKKQSEKAATEPFLAVETPEEAKVPDAQPPLSPSPLSETPISFSGVPTSYSHPVTESEFVDSTNANASADVQPESKGEELAVATDEKGDVQLVESQLDRVDVEDQKVSVDEGKTTEKETKECLVIEEPSANVQPTTESLGAVTEVPGVPTMISPAEEPETSRTEESTHVEHLPQPKPISPEESALPEPAAGSEESNVIAIEPTVDIVEPEAALSGPPATSIEQPKAPAEDENDTRAIPSKKKKGKKGKRESAILDVTLEDTTLQPSSDVVEQPGKVTGEPERSTQAPSPSHEPSEGIKEALEVVMPEVLTGSSAAGASKDGILPEPNTSTTILEEPATGVSEPEQPTEIPTEGSLTLISKADKKEKEQASIPIVEPEAVSKVQEPPSEKFEVPLEQRSNELPENPKETQGIVAEQPQTVRMVPETSSELPRPESTEEAMEPTVSKKEKKKKGKKAKGQSGIATPVEQNVPEDVVEKAKDVSAPVETSPPEVDQPVAVPINDASLDTSTRDEKEDEKAMRLVPAMPAIELPSEPAVSDETAPSIADGPPHADVVDTPAVPASAVQAESVPLSKKDRKKAKKSKAKSSDAAASIVEDAPTRLATDIPEVDIADQGNELTVEDNIAAPASQDEVPSPAFQEEILAPVVEEKVPISTTQEDMPKELVENRKMIADEATPVISNEDPVHNQEPIVEPSDTTVTPVQESEQVPEESGTAMSSKKKKGKNGKKSGISTPALEEQGPVEAVSDTPSLAEVAPVATSEPTLAEAIENQTPPTEVTSITQEPQMDMKPRIEESTPESQPTKAVEDKVKPAEPRGLKDALSIPTSETVTTPIAKPVEHAPITEPVLDVTTGAVDTEDTVPGRKLSKKERKALAKADLSAPIDESIIEDTAQVEAEVKDSAPISPVADLIKTDTTRDASQGAEMSTEVPSASVETVPVLPEASVAAPEVVEADMANKQDTVVDDESPLKKGKKNKKDKKSKKASFSLDTAEASQSESATAEPIVSEPFVNLEEAQDKSSVTDSMPDRSPKQGPSAEPPPVQPTPKSQEFVDRTTGESAQQDMGSPFVVDGDQAFSDEQPTPVTFTESSPAIDPAPTTMIQGDEENALVSRKASKKRNKGKKASIATDESAAIIEETTIPAVPSTEEQEISKETTLVSAPTEKFKTLDPGQSSEIEQAEPSLIVPVLETPTQSSETNIESSKPTKAVSAKTEADSGSTPSKKSKKDKKKTRKSTHATEDIALTEPSDNTRLPGEQSTTVLPSFEKPTNVQDTILPTPEDRDVPLPDSKTQDTDIVQQDEKASELTREDEQKPKTFDEPEAALSRTPSTKSEKKVKMSPDGIDNPKGEEPVSSVPNMKTEPVATPEIQHVPSDGVLDLPEAAVDCQGPGSTTQDAPQQDAKVEDAGDAQNPHVPIQKDSRDTAVSTVEPAAEGQVGTQPKNLPPSELSPSLKAIQDEVADLKARSEALDNSLAKEEVPKDISPSSASKPSTSVVDIVNKLNKKEKKKTKKVKDSGLDSTPTTPAADSLAAVETKETKETAGPSAVGENDRALEPAPTTPAAESSVVVETKEGFESPTVEDELRAPDTFMPELVKADEQVVDEKIAESRPSENLETSQDAIIAPITIETSEPDKGEHSVPSRKSSKKDKKKQAKASAISKNEPLPDNNEVQPTTTTEAELEKELKSPAAVEQSTPFEVSPSTSHKLDKREKSPQALPSQQDDVPVENAASSASTTEAGKKEVQGEENDDLSKQEQVRDDAKVAKSSDQERVASEVDQTVIDEETDVSLPGQNTPPAVVLEETVNPSLEAPSVAVDIDAASDVKTTDVMEEENTVTPAPTRKKSKKEKKESEKKDTIMDVAEPDKSDNTAMGQSGPVIEPVSEPQRTIEKDIPTTLDMQPEHPVNITRPPTSEKPSQSTERTSRSGTEPVLLDENRTQDPTSSFKDKGKRKLDTVTAPSGAIIAHPPVPTQADVKSVPRSGSKSDAVFLEDTNVTIEQNNKEIPVDTVKKAAEATSPPTAHNLQEAIEIPEAAEPETRSSKTSKKEKRRSKKDAEATEKPLVAAIEANAGTPAAKLTPTAQDKTPVASHPVKDLPPTSSQPSFSLEEQQTPSLSKKPSKTQQLAALFERGTSAEESTSARELRRDGIGSVKDLAERYEGQSRSVTPVLQPHSDKRNVSRAASQDKLRTHSPAHDVDFAATVAASLSESGFDPGYVINDSTFHRSTSSHSVRDIGHDDEVAAAKERATTSRLGSLSRSSSFSGSPRMRPVKDLGPSVLPPIEVAAASTDAISFDPLDVLNDPTFSRRKTPPGVLEEADPDELYISPNVTTRARGKKKRALPSDTAVKSGGDDKSSRGEGLVVPGEAPSESTLADLSDKPSNQESIDASPNTSSKKDRKSKDKKDTKQTPLAQDRVEYAATETPAIETPTQETLAVETPADSTVRKVETKKSGPLASLPESVPLQQEKSVGRKISEQVTPGQQTSVDHKRRAHPVASEEDEPEGKRLHTLEPRTAEEGSTTREPTTGTKPDWSLPGIRDSAVDVTDSPIRTVTPSLHENTRDDAVIQRPQVEQVQAPISEKKRTSKEPKTPTHQSIRRTERDQETEESPSLPHHSAHTGVPAPSGTDRATKERTSYLFDSSPSTRGFETPAAIVPETPMVIDTPSKDSRTSSRSTEKTSKPHNEMSPTKEVKKTEPYQSIFGDPSEKSSVKSPTLSMSSPKHMRTPGNLQLDTIKEASPDDSQLHKKSRAITDVGAPDRGVKSARHAESSKTFTDRLKSPPPVSPTPSSRRSLPAPDTTGRRTPSGSKDTPWHQVNESVDRNMTLSPARRMPRSSPSMDPIKQHMAEQRSPSVRSERSMSNIAKTRTTDQERPLSSLSSRSTQSLRRIDRSASGDLRNAARLGEVNAPDARSMTPNNLSDVALAAGATAAIAAESKYDPVRGEGKGRRSSMPPETYEAWGEAQGSSMSPTRPPSVRKRQSMQIMDLQSQLDQLAAQNHSLEEATKKAEEALQATQHQRQIDEQLIAEEVEARDREIHKRDIEIAQLKDTIQRLHEEIRRLTELNNTLNEANRNLTNDTNERYAQLQSEGQLIQQQWEASQRELEALRKQQEIMTRGMADAVRDEVGIALDERNAEIDRLTAELTSAKEQVKALQKQILATKKPGESFLTVRDEDYFDSACQQLCQHVQQWVLRFSKFSDTRPCRLSSEISADTRLDSATRQKIDTRLDNAILDGSDVDALLADRVKRRDVFMSVVMTMIWEYVFTRYLFGMDREQRQKLKSLEKTLSEVGPPRAVAQWRAITLTLLSKREPFIQQRAQDTEAVVQEIYSTLSTLLPPPSNLERQIQESLRNVMRLAVELSIEMRTQRAEYIMLPPLQPEYDTNGDLVAKVTFNASLMNERSGDTTSNEELESRGSIVKIVLFPLVVKKGDDFGEGQDEIVVCPAQVLVAKPSKKVVRVSSQAMSINRPDSRSSRISRMTSIVPDGSVMDLSK